jgi:NAD(P)-dependent dehydrogenase (short-subunit alcohol dehydrogenase family)
LVGREFVKHGLGLKDAAEEKGPIPLGARALSGAGAAEVAKAALFLASDDSSFVAGIELFVDGGSAAI